MTEEKKTPLNTHNTARYFVEQPQVGWVLLVFVLAWGVFGYLRMPQRKDPDMPVRDCLTVVPWQGQSAEKIEQLVAKKVEEKIAGNNKVTELRSVSRNGVTYIYTELDERTTNTDKEFDDIKLRLDSIFDLPEGAGPIQFVKDFGDTSALMLTVASPPADPLVLDLRARDVALAIERLRRNRKGRLSVAVCFPQSVDAALVRRPAELLSRRIQTEGAAHDLAIAGGPGFVVLDFATELSEPEIAAYVARSIATALQQSEFDPDVWYPAVIGDPGTARAKLAAVAGDKYTYRQLDDFTDAIQKSVQSVPQVAKVTRAGVLDERVFLNYSRDRLAAYNIQLSQLPAILAARNTSAPGGTLNVGGRNVFVSPTGEFRNEKDIGNVVIAATTEGAPVYLRDIVEPSRGYQTPPRFLNFLTLRGKDGQWHRTRAVTLALEMRQGEQIRAFGRALDENLRELATRLPSDLILAHTSDQPRQVEENVDLFMWSLGEAVILVVLVSLVGFWEWRSALLMALAIPITLAMTFGTMYMVGIDLQQVSIATLIIALGLLVDDPVVAGDAIKRDLAAGLPPGIAAWWGPTRLSRAIVFATFTNIVAYLPFLLLRGDTGRFIFSLPVVITISLVASRLVSMTFIPLLGKVLLRSKPELPISERRDRGFAHFYYRVGGFAIDHRKTVLAATLLFLALGGVLMKALRPQFFPQDLQYLSYADVWLPEDASITATQQAAAEAERAIRDTAGDRLRSLTSFVGGGGPRFWFSAPPEPPQLNYAQIVVEMKDKRDTSRLAPAMQRAVSQRVAGARVDIRELETGKPVGIPVSIRVSGDDLGVLRQQAERLKQILRSVPITERVRDDWGEATLAIRLKVNPDRASMAGVTSQDVAEASSGALGGTPVAMLREGDRQIPVIAVARLEERSQLGDLENLYVYSRQSPQRVPIRQVASLEHRMEAAQIRRLNQFRTITVSAFPAAGFLPSQVTDALMPKIREVEQTLPPGYRLQIAGEYREQVAGFKELGVVMGVSVASIFIALVIQFRHAVKPLIVFAAIPYGIVGALLLLWIMGQPFGFMAFLGVASLIGVIVSHIIVLFDYIEEMHENGQPLRQALLDAGILRLRPVLITVGATVIALIPLALHGGPLWEPLCYAQIGGLSVATMITLLLVPVLYAMFVMDLKWVKWHERPQTAENLPAEEET
ncbi:MAG: AcrB/AcrD/AcrF family protein [Bryobacterales bacterium]|nr:AcrB/AcrD/AcrF family protein [Bryobacterales bacterium]